MHQPLISVVVTTYNNNQYLAGALDSIVTQQYPNTEVIVVDDGSTDQQSKQITEQFKQSSSILTVYIYQDNQGPAAARNRGLDQAQGEYVCFLDADDKFAAAKLSIQCQRLNELHADYACVLGSAATFTGADHNSEIGQRRTVTPTAVDGELDRAQFVSGDVRLEGTPGYLFRRSALVTVKGYDEDLRHFEDFDLLLRLSEHFKIKTHTQITFHQRLHPDSLSQRDAVAGLKSALLFVEKVAVRFPRLPQAALNRRRQRAHYSAALWCLRQRRFSDFRWLMLAGAKLGNSPRTWRGRAALWFAKLLPIAAKEPLGLS